MNWEEILKLVVTLILPRTKLAPIAGEIASGILEAEALKGSATGAEKLIHVVNLAELAAKGAADAGVAIDPAGIRTDAGGIISAVVDITNQVKKIHDQHPLVPAAPPV